MRFKICDVSPETIDREVLGGFFKTLLFVCFALIFFDLFGTLLSLDSQLALYSESPTAFLQSHLQIYLYASPSVLIGLLMGSALLWRKYRDGVVEVRSHQVLIMDSMKTVNIRIDEISSLRVSDIHGLFPFGGDRRFKTIELVKKRRFLDHYIQIRIEPQDTCEEFLQKLGLKVPVSYRDLNRLFKARSSSQNAPNSHSETPTEGQDFPRNTDK
jgi:hypothetical protein